jgi:hypothetical protein
MQYDLGALKKRWHKEVVNNKDVEEYWYGLNHCSTMLCGFLLGAGVPREQADDIVRDALTNGWGGY